jgi:hypothetical protein
MASRACFINFGVEASRAHQNPRNAIQIVQGSYKLFAVRPKVHPPALPLPRH